MSSRKYGVLRGRVVATAEERGDQQSPHYQMMVVADGEPWRVAANVKSTASDGGPDRAIVLYRIDEDFRHPIVEVLKSFPEGFQSVPAGANEGGLDYIRGNLFNPRDMRLLPPDLPGDDNDLNDLLDAHVQQARADSDAVIFSFGIPWGPENKPDKTFGFKPNRGVHDIHMNQGNPLDGGHAGDNGVWQDGGLVLWFPDADRWVAIFLAFQSQSWHTNDRTGQPIKGETGAEPAKFDEEGQRLSVDQQTHSSVEIVATRVKEAKHQRPAVMLLNTANDDVDLSNWSLAASEEIRQALEGSLAAGATVAVEVPDNFFDKRGSTVTLLDPAELKVAAMTYPALSRARSGWNR
ncbi:DUF2278 family protein [Paraburkholderia hospita]|uniref:DUF2278 family protein n=1 Tax=Paraburkholderia hospita TaxID=169430 RepID=UPI000B348A85|nr:DUF2278 family protein [Paraburkholderia hospita]OUL96280.1 hypothetical protein CA601_03025 [Paraburkholderia hospita]